MPELGALPRAVPVLLRHLGAYAELAAQDIANGRDYLRARLGSLVAFSASVGLCVLVTCTAVIASFWDTPYRFTSLYSLVALSVIMTGATGWHAWRVRRRQPPFLDAVRNEWNNDRPILQRVIFGEADESPDKSDGKSDLDT